MLSLNNVDVTFHAIDVASIYMHDVWVREAGNKRVGLFSWLKKRAGAAWHSGDELEPLREDQECRAYKGNVYVFDDNQENELPLLVTIMSERMHEARLETSDGKD